MISENKLPFVRERVGASPSHVVLLEHEHLLPDLGEQGGHGEAADAAADHDGVQVGGDLVLEKPKMNCIKLSQVGNYTVCQIYFHKWSCLYTQNRLKGTASTFV